MIKLPKDPNVVTLLTDYYEQCQSKAAQGAVVKKYVSCALYVFTCGCICSLNLLKEVMDGIITYFDFTLFDHLLYAPERKQYEAVVSRQVPILTPAQQCSEDTPVEYCSDGVELPSRIYGVEHLLRLFGMYNTNYLNTIIDHFSIECENDFTISIVMTKNLCF